MTSSDKSKSRTRRVLGRAGQVVAGVNVLFNLSGSPRVPEADVARSQEPQAAQQVKAQQVRAQQLQRQWASNQKNEVLPRWRTQANELGDQLREPVSGEHRPSERQRHDDELSRQPSRARSRQGADRAQQGRTDEGRGR